MAQTDEQKQVSSFKSNVTRSCKARAAAKPEQEAKWGIEATKLATELVAGHFTANEINPAFLKDMALYAVQKVRKLALFATGQKASIDPATMEVLRAARVLMKAEQTFTPSLQQAALSKAVETTDAGLAKLSRGAYSKGTAASQSQTSRQALCQMGLAINETVDGRKNCLVVDFENIVVKALFGEGEITLMAVADEASSEEAPDETASVEEIEAAMAMEEAPATA